MKKMLSGVLLTTIILGLIMISSPYVTTSYATNVIGIITSNQTWTKANSPYSLTGPTAIDRGVTITVEAGTTVLLNNFYIQINGTLRVIGSNSDPIQFLNGSLIYKPISNGWNNVTGSGCIIENANLTSTSISADITLKLNQNSIDGEVTVGNSSIITNNNVKQQLRTGSSCLFVNNILTGVSAGDNCNFTNNTIEPYSITGTGITAGDSCTVTRNIVRGGVSCNGITSVIANNSIDGGAGTGTILNNDINGTVRGYLISNNNIVGSVFAYGSETVSNNVIKGGGYYLGPEIIYPPVRFHITYYYGAIDIRSGSPTIFNNIIDGGITDNVTGSSPRIFNNIVTAVGKSAVAMGAAPFSYFGGVNEPPDIGGTPEIFNNTVTSIFAYANSCNISRNIVNGSIEAPIGDSLIVGNTAGKISVGGGNVSIIGNAANGITCASVSYANILDNIIKDGTGINGQNSGIIKRNYIFNNTIGIEFRFGNATIQDNTIANNNIGIRLYPDSSKTQIYNNNILSINFSIYLVLGQESWSGGINATYNWWGTTNQTAIRDSFYDFNDDFNLPSVTFTPILTTSNSAAMPDPTVTQPPVIPEKFSSSIILTLLIIVSLAGAIVFKQKKDKTELKQTCTPIRQENLHATPSKQFIL